MLVAIATLATLSFHHIGIPGIINLCLYRIVAMHIIEKLYLYKILYKNKTN